MIKAGLPATGKLVGRVLGLYNFAQSSAKPSPGARGKVHRRLYVYILVNMSSARRNNSSDADFEEQAFAEGGYRWVAKGRYTKGQRRGRLCVRKWFKRNFAMLEESFFELDIQAVERAQWIIDEFNDECIINDTIYLNHPEVWSNHDGRSYLVEPWISNFVKWNSNSGKTFGHGYWSEAMQALSHYSYHRSGGQMVLCDLQGGIQAQRGRHNQAVLTDPVILSRDRRFGVTDLGPQGISTFFHYHRCNQFCDPAWQEPRDCSRYISCIAGTSMMGNNGTYQQDLGGYACQLGGIAEEGEDDEYNGSSDDYY